MTSLSTTISNEPRLERPIHDAMRRDSFRRAAAAGEWIQDKNPAPSTPAKVLWSYNRRIAETVALERLDTSRQLFLLLCRQLKSNQRFSDTFINDFPGEPYRVVAPIPVVIESTNTDFVARFVEANVAMSGDSPEEALGNLAASILDTFEDYSAEPVLGPAPARQLAVLRRHLAHR